ncbi:hypothetical protein [Thermococcus peptonophilus]|uniref:hypothetical protein n=1 Tax=Thermococcus peptonophilus TaxID=53952 RepID=UPI0006D0F5FD
MERYGLAVRYDVFKEGLQEKLTIIDIFGSFNDSRLIIRLYITSRVLIPRHFWRRPLQCTAEFSKFQETENRLEYTLTIDGMVDLFGGEEATIKILRRNIALKIKARESENKPGGPLNIFLMNRDRVSPKFMAWLLQYAEHIVDFNTTEIPGVERMVVRKSLLPEFTPAEAEFRFSKADLR